MPWTTDGLGAGPLLLPHRLLLPLSLLWVLALGGRRWQRLRRHDASITPLLAELTPLLVGVGVGVGPPLALGEVVRRLDRWGWRWRGKRRASLAVAAVRPTRVVVLVRVAVVLLLLVVLPFLVLTLLLTRLLVLHLLVVLALVILVVVVVVVILETPVGHQQRRVGPLPQWKATAASATAAAVPQAGGKARRTRREAYQLKAKNKKKNGCASKRLQPPPLPPLPLLLLPGTS